MYGACDPLIDSVCQEDFGEGNRCWFLEEISFGKMIDGARREHEGLMKYNRWQGTRKQLYVYGGGGHTNRSTTDDDKKEPTDVVDLGL